jgi:tRNA(fMet)-specific endonuclease VapC
MKYLLDTCTVSDFVKGHPEVMVRLKATSPKQIVVSWLTRMEIDCGLAINPERARTLAPMLDAFFSVISTVPFDQSDAQASAAIRAALKSKGQPIGAYDALIAGTGVARGLIVVTSNIGEFDRISGLQAENWRDNKKG